MFPLELLFRCLLWEARRNTCPRQLLAKSQGSQAKKDENHCILMGLSLIILLSWRGPWCIKWCQYHKEECDLKGDERTFHMCKGRTKGTIPTSWFLKTCILHPSLLSPGQRKLFMLGKNKLATINFSARLLFPSSYYFISHLVILVMPWQEAARNEQLSMSPEITVWW